MSKIATKPTKILKKYIKIASQGLEKSVNLIIFATCKQNQSFRHFHEIHNIYNWMHFAAYVRDSADYLIFMPK